MSYLSELLDVDYLSKAVKKAARAVRKIKPDILIGTGISGTICATAVGQYVKLPVGILRKEDDNSHSSETFELPGHYKFPDSWFFIDDIIGSGDTFRKVIGFMEEKFPKSQCSGILLLIRGVEYCPSSSVRKTKYCPRWSDGIREIPIFGCRPKGI